jgi:hypothetical protein
MVILVYKQRYGLSEKHHPQWLKNRKAKYANEFTYVTFNSKAMKFGLEEALEKNWLRQKV